MYRHNHLCATVDTSTHLDMLIRNTYKRQHMATYAYIVTWPYLDTSLPLPIDIPTLEHMLIRLCIVVSTHPHIDMCAYVTNLPMYIPLWVVTLEHM